jgi:hypothetical protein
MIAVERGQDRDGNLDPKLSPDRSAEDGNIEMFAASGPIEASSLRIALALPQ